MASLPNSHQGPVRSPPQSSVTIAAHLPSEAAEHRRSCWRSSMLLLLSIRVCVCVLCVCVCVWNAPVCPHNRLWPRQKTNLVSTQPIARLPSVAQRPWPSQSEPSLSFSLSVSPSFSLSLFSSPSLSLSVYLSLSISLSHKHTDEN